MSSRPKGLDPLYSTKEWKKAKSTFNNSRLRFEAVAKKVELFRHMTDFVLQIHKTFKKEARRFGPQICNQ